MQGVEVFLTEFLFRNIGRYERHFDEQGWLEGCDTIVKALEINDLEKGCVQKRPLLGLLPGWSSLGSEKVLSAAKTGANPVPISIRAATGRSQISLAHCPG